MEDQSEDSKGQDLTLTTPPSHISALSLILAMMPAWAPVCVCVGGEGEGLSDKMGKLPTHTCDLQVLGCPIAHL